jgi:hypothetical protein
MIGICWPTSANLSSSRSTPPAATENLHALAFESNSTMRSCWPRAISTPLPIGLFKLSFHVCWLLAIISRGPHAHAQSIADDQQALVDLFASTGGRASNASTGWRRSTRWLTFNHTHPSQGVCLWWGVQCGPSACLLPANASWTPPPCRVTALNLRNNNLVGTLAAATIARLDALQVVDIRHVIDVAIFIFSNHSKPLIDKPIFTLV